jgi:predicted lipoprotein with Yx(FWY)xxD motif
MLHSSRLIALCTVSVALTVAACGSDDSNDDGGGAATPATDIAKSDTTTTAEEAPGPKGTTIRLDDSQYGRVLFDGRGQAIYLFDKEQSDRSECYGDCAAAWPPVLTEGEPVAAAGIKQGLLGTTKRTDGKTQVTYNGHPLYFYAHEGRNEVRCHNVTEFGGVWLALNDTGNALD